MPRDGTGNYNQPFPNVAPDTTIESVVYNGFVQDVALDLNTARPIIAGGTGAISAEEAITALGAETASQLVANYDSHLWKPGSFYSAPGATNAPIAGEVSGVCHMANENNVTLEARQYVAGVTTPAEYVRQRASGVWSAWLTQDPATGGTVTGDVTISKAAPFLNLDATTASEPSIRGQRSGITRWGMSFASLEAEAGGNTGSDWYLAAFNDAGSYIHTALFADRATGLVTVNGNPTSALGIATKQIVDLKAPIDSPNFTGVIKDNGAQLFAGFPPIFKASGSGTVAIDEQKIILVSGDVTIQGTVHPIGTCLTFFASGGVLNIGNTQTMYFNLGGSALTGLRVLSSVGVATAIKLSSTEWVISGNGLT